ncbi:MAG: 1-deoxy-D-xylulose-5-phosphate reductoisomerase, partial [Planctomycetota bacterium]|nr:1-deoxy-D-xylulose-5-phosphate reductoisomerase [Planctomycetota bacterium]
MKRVAILGATGSVGCSTLRLLADRRDRFEVVFLAAHRSEQALLEQVAANDCPYACLSGVSKPPSAKGCQVFSGATGILEGLEASTPDLVLNAITGAAGLEASAWTLEQDKNLLLANKESLVVAGPLLRRLAHDGDGRILPVDSEHAAIHQCLRGEREADLRRVYLTASGGPFRDLPTEDFLAITPKEALNHPTWDMGPRITVGSATLMNKAFEVIEAHWLFGLSAEQIEVVVHRQSIVHSLVEFRDGSVMAQLGVPDMRVPILYCLGWPGRLDFDFSPFNVHSFAHLTFEEADRARFPALDLGYHCLELGGTAGAVLNAADEVCTHAFLDGRIPFPRIVETVERVLASHTSGSGARSGVNLPFVREVESVAQVLEVDTWAR